jgi:3D (Asp-Asp-Asp) domain-containing protein
MKNNIIAGLVLGLVITSSGWVMSHDMNEQLTEIIVDKNEKIQKKSTEIANLEKAIVVKDKKLDAEKLVIEKQKDQLQGKQKEIERLEKLVEQKDKVIENFKKEKKGSDVGGRKGSAIGTFEMTSYIAMCREGCTGITATGVNVKNTKVYQGHRIIATDPNVIPLWSIVRIHTKSGSFTAISLDTGGGIDGREIDFLVSSESEALENGRQNVSVEMIRRGK